MSERFIASVDQGTASSRCLIFDERSRIVSVSQIEHRHLFPRPGRVEHDPEEIWHNVQHVITDALATAQLGVGDLVGLGITNQRETTVVWDRRSGEPVHNALTWQDMRTDHLVHEIAGDARRGPLPRPLRPAARHVLLGAEDPLAARQRRRPPRTRRGG